MNKRTQLTRVTQLKNKKVQAIACGKNFVIALGKTVRKADFFKEIDQSTYETSTQRLENGLIEVETSTWSAKKSHRLDMTPSKRRTQSRNTSPLDFRESSFDREAKARLSTGSNGKSPEVRGFWTDAQTGRREPPKEPLPHLGADDLIGSREEIKKLRSQVEYLEGQVEHRTRQNLFYENKIEELKRIAIENEQKDKKMHNLLDNIEVEHQRYRKDLNRLEQILAERDEALYKKDQEIEELKAVVLRLGEDKRNLIDLSQSFEYLRDLELDKAATAAAASSRQGSKEDTFRANFHSQKKRTPESLNEMIKFYESRISRLKEMIDWGNYSPVDVEERQYEYLASRNVNRGVEGDLSYNKESSQDRTADVRINDSYGGERGYYLASALKKETPQKLQPVMNSARTTKATNEPSPAKLKSASEKSPPVRKEQSSLIKKNTTSSSSVLKTKSSIEKPVLKPYEQGHHHTKSGDSQAFYSNVKSLLKDVDTPDYSTEMVSQVHDGSDEGSEQAHN